LLSGSRLRFMRSFWSCITSPIVKSSHNFSIKDYTLNIQKREAKM
jgi:hypothetical protein